MCAGTAAACTFASAGTVCVPASCDGHTEILASTCDGKGICVPGATMMCSTGCSVLDNDMGVQCNNGGRLTGGGASCSLAPRGADPGSFAIIALALLLGMLIRRRR
jgi:hypothetical protein